MRARRGPPSDCGRVSTLPLVLILTLTRVLILTLTRALKRLLASVHPSPNPNPAPKPSPNLNPNQEMLARLGGDAPPCADGACSVRQLIRVRVGVKGKGRVRGGLADRNPQPNPSPTPTPKPKPHPHPSQVRRVAAVPEGWGSEDRPDRLPLTLPLTLTLILPRPRAETTSRLGTRRLLPRA